VHLREYAAAYQKNTLKDMGTLNFSKMDQNQMLKILAKKNFEVKRIFIFTTKNCNLSCPYCFVKNEDKDIDLNFAKEIIDQFVESKGNDKLLYYYGGEPLLKVEILRELESYYSKILEMEGKRGSSIVVTNGTIMNDKIINFFDKHKVRLMISLCGKEKRHNNHRPYAIGGHGTFADVLKNMNKFTRIVDKKDIWVSYTFTKSMVPFLNEDLTYLHQLGFENLHLEPIQFYNLWDDKSISLFKKEYQKFLGFLLSKMDEGSMIFISKILRILEMMDNKNLYSKETYDFYTHLRFWPPNHTDFFHFKIDGLNKKILYAGNKLWHAYNTINKNLVGILMKYQEKPRVKNYLREGMKRVI
jgi:sulfatase maturation enzyme AslB (radical SAM superfamily)